MSLERESVKERVYLRGSERERENENILIRNAIKRENKRGREVQTKWHLVFNIRLNIKKQRARLKTQLRRLWFHPENSYSHIFSLL